MRTSLSAHVMYVTLAAMLSVFTAAPLYAQSADFTPVTDAMLEDPAAGGLADVAPHARRLGLQPARPGRPRQRRHGCAWSGRAPSDRGQPGRDAAGLRRLVVHAEPAATSSRHIDAETGDVSSGSTAATIRRIVDRVHARQSHRSQPEHRDLRHATSSTPASTTTSSPSTPSHRPSWPGKRRSSTTRVNPARHSELRADHRRRQGGLGTKLHAAGRPRTPASSYRPRRDDRRRGLASAHRSPRRASRATRPGAASPSRSACTSDPGWRRATTRR